MTEQKKEFNEILSLAYFYLKFRPRTEREIHDYLLKKGIKQNWSDELIQSVIENLKEESLIDDKKFIKQFVEERALLKPKGTYVLKAELIRHGISHDLIEEYFFEQTIDEEDLAYQAIVKRWDRLCLLPEDKRFKKAMDFLLRRGFSFDIAKNTIRKLE